MIKLAALSLIIFSVNVFAEDFNHTYCGPMSDQDYKQHILGAWKGRSIILGNKEYTLITTYNKNAQFFTNAVGDVDTQFIGKGTFNIKNSILTLTFINQDGSRNNSSMKLICLGPHILHGMKNSKELVVNLREK